MGDDEALRELYAASYVRLVGTVGAVVRDRDLAQQQGQPQQRQAQVGVHRLQRHVRLSRRRHHT